MATMIQRQIAFALVALALIPSAGSARAASRFDWWPTTSAPYAAPVYIVRGDLTLTDGGHGFVPDHQVADNGWAAINAIEIIGETHKALPRELALTWFSFAEDRFYSGLFDLPVERLEALFRRAAPLPPPRPRAAYDTVIVGMAPGGNVTVWASAGPVITEVATFRAAPAEVPWTAVVGDGEVPVARAEFVRREIDSARASAGPERLAGRPTATAAWATFPRRLAWMPRLTGADHTGAVVWVHGLNGEKDWLDLADPTRHGEPPPPTLPVPGDLTLSWNTPADHLMAEIRLDSTETLAAFAALDARDDPSDPLTLELAPAANGATVEVTLRHGTRARRLARCRVQVYGTG